jgi:pseudaminic acid cytidylyltransferase
MNLCVIPARGGSKRIPHKNIRLFCGKPMIVWSIEAAINSKCFDRIIVSTDDLSIADIAKKHGAEIPFIRPNELSGDYVATIPVVAHAIRWVGNGLVQPSKVCCIYATAPFVRAEDLKLGLAMLEASKAEYAFSVTSFEYPIQRALKITQTDRVEMFQPEFLNSRSQDLIDAWHDAGQFYWGKSSAWLNEKNMFNKNSVPVQLPRYRVQDIDTLEDWERAEWMFKTLLKK